MPTYPAILGQSAVCPNNPPATKNILTAAILAGSFFFVFAGDWAMPDQDAIHVMVSKYQIPTVDIVPAAKATLSGAIRASIFEYPWFAVDPAVGKVDAGDTPWSEQVASKGLDKWSPSYPTQTPWAPPRALSPGIQATGFTEVPPSQYPAKTWDSNPWKTGLYPDDFTSRYQDNLPHWYFKSQGEPASILAGSFAFVDFSNAAAKDWLPGARNLNWMAESPGLQLRDKAGLPQAILAGSFAFVDFGRGAAAYKDWVLDPAKAGWQVGGPDVIPHFTVKKGLSEAMQAGAFWTVPYMPLAINYVKNFIMEEFFPDIQIHWMFEKKKTVPAAILAGSFFEVPPVNAAKTWVQNLITMGWRPDYPDIVPVGIVNLTTAIQAGSSFFVEFADGTSAWLEIVDVGLWMPIHQDVYRVNPTLNAAIQSSLEPACVLPGTDVAWPTPATPGLAVGTLLTGSDGSAAIYLGDEMITSI